MQTILMFMLTVNAKVLTWFGLGEVGFADFAISIELYFWCRLTNSY